MQVKELVERLKKVDQEALVVLPDFLCVQSTKEVDGVLIISDLSEDDWHESFNT